LQPLNYILGVQNSDSMYDLFIEFITDIMLVKSNGIHNETQSADYKSKMPKK